MSGIARLETAGRRTSAGRVACAACLIIAAALPSAAQSLDPAPVVREDHGVYSVTARFSVVGSTAIALATLTDYGNIPRFMPAVTSSTVVEHGESYAIVEQEAAPAFLWFSKRIHLRLEIKQQAGTIAFTDRCGRSFDRYEGTWTVTEDGRRATVEYRLVAKPAFDVPAFMLKRLLKRDAVQMIGQLQAEIAARAAAR
jgi:hypothetical protein